jgi:hypothetical protein
MGWASAASIAASKSARGVDAFGIKTCDRLSTGTSKLSGLPPNGMLTVGISIPLKKAGPAYKPCRLI